MKRTMTTTEAAGRFEELLASVCKGGDEVVFEREGEPVAVLIDLATYERIERERFWASLDTREGGVEAVPEDELLEMVVREVKAHRRERVAVPTEA